MFGFELTEEQKALRQLARDFARREIQPVAMELDRLETAQMPQAFPWDLVRRGSKLGFRTLSLPREWGGAGADAIAQLLVIDELGYADVSCSKMFSQNWKIASYVVFGGTDSQKQRFLPEFGERDDYLLALAATEPEAGGDIMGYYDAPGGEGLMTTAKRDGQSYVVSGKKQWVSHGPVASLFLIWVRTDPTVVASRGTSVLLAPKSTPGLRVGSIHDKLGWRAYLQSEILLEGAKVPVENLLGGREAWINPEVARQGGAGAIDVPAHLTALARAALDAAVKYSSERRQGGQALIKHQAIAGDLADMYIDLQAARGVLWRVAAAAARHHPDPALNHAARVLSGETAARICTRAMDIFGGYGVVRDMPVQKWVRDSLSILHGEGGHKIQRLLLGRVLENRYRSGVPIID